MTYHRLENSIIDVIKEEQAKLGYRKEEIRLYYPLSSLDHFFETSADAEEMKKILAGFGAYTKEKLGNVLVSNKGERFCFHIQEQGAEYVHEHMKPNEFIRELVELVGKHGCTMQQVKDLFLSKGKQIQMEPVDNGEFDLMIRFEGDAEDPYYYCFKDEGCHIIYHRFLPEVYADFDISITFLYYARRMQGLKFLDRCIFPYYNLCHIKHIELVGNKNERDFMLWRFQHIWFNTWNKRTV